MKRFSTMISVLICSSGIVPAGTASAPDHGQGEMAGRVTETSVILQSRLTKGNKLINGDLPGNPGVARFELATDPQFKDSRETRWLKAVPDYDYIVKVQVTDLKPATKYYYRLLYGAKRSNVTTGRTCSFKTLGGKDAVQPTRFAVVTGMNYFFFHEGPYNPKGAYKGGDKHLGYPALEAIRKLEPDFFVGTGDNVYFDHPAQNQKGNRWTGLAWSDRAKTEAEMRRKYHEQFIQPRYIELFANVPTYWEVDDHDYRFNDCDNTGDKTPTPEMGARNFREQLPVVDPQDPAALTYATFRVSRDLQIWLVEGRLYRSPNRMPDGPEKTIWGETQKRWLKETLLASDATFKILISPTPLVGPDGKGKRDSHCNIGGFRHEGQEFFDWLGQNGFLEKNFYILCGDRHWQYHARDGSGFEEFASGALVDANSRFGVKAGTPNSTDPDGMIEQFYCKLKGDGEPSGGFMLVTVTPVGSTARTTFTFYDEQGRQVYSHTKQRH
jgi:alkaline phosphatase/alkaline phosphatase D